MPRDVLAKEWEGKAPTVAHFAVLIDDSGQAIALGPGSMWQLVDPAEGSPIPLVLKECSPARIVFQMAGTDYVYRLTGAKPLTRDAYKRLKAQGKVK